MNFSVHGKTRDDSASSTWSYRAVTPYLSIFTEQQASCITYEYILCSAGAGGRRMIYFPPCNGDNGGHLVQWTAWIDSWEEMESPSLEMQPGFMLKGWARWKLWSSDCCVSIDGTDLDMDCMCIAACKWNSFYCLWLISFLFMMLRFEIIPGRPRF